MLTSEQKKSILSSLSIIMVAGILFGLFLFNWANIPVVYFNYPSNYCVKVISPNPIHNCENLPTNYQHEWTQRP